MAKITDKYPNLKVFVNHGFIYEGESGNQVYGYSIFSGSNTFYINPKTKMWDCKTSGKNGGYQQFLKEVHQLSLENLTIPKRKILEKSRLLAKSTLKHHKVGYNAEMNRYIVPIFDAVGKNINDLKRFNANPKADKKFKMISTSGATASLYGWEDLDTASIVWLVEGEWDKMAMWEVLNKTKKLGKETVVSVPGALTFKNDWTTLLEGKEVRVVYDNDKEKILKGRPIAGAGGQGCMKVYKALKNITKSLTFVHWESDRKDGFDVRDFVTDADEYLEAYDGLVERLSEDIPVKKEFKKEVQKESENNEDVYPGPMIGHEDVYAAYRKWLYLPNADVLDMMFGTVIANRLEGDPLWLFIVAPSGATKSELLMSISDAPRIKSTTTMTPKALVSGANTAGGGDPSLIPKLDKKVLIIKDFTAILSMNEQARDEIFGIFRDAFDGKIEKDFGNGVIRKYTSKFGILSGVTPAIDLYTEGQTALGERFLRYRVSVGETFKEQAVYIKRAQGNVNKEGNMREELLEVGTAVLSHNYTVVPEVPDNIKEKIIALAQWTAAIRATIVRDKFSKEVMASPMAELGTRLVKQLTKVMLGVSMFRGLKEVTDSEFKLARDVAVGCIPGDLNKIVKYLYKTRKCKYVPLKDIQEKSGVPSESCRRKLENLILLKVISKKKAVTGMEYVIHKEIKFLFKTGEIYNG